MVLSMRCKMQNPRMTANQEREHRFSNFKVFLIMSPDRTYTANSKSVIPLPEQDAIPGSPSHISNYPEFPIGSFVMALYPDTSCFYRAEVIATRAAERVRL